jgi:hypothetical protein
MTDPLIVRRGYNKNFGMFWLECWMYVKVWNIVFPEDIIYPDCKTGAIIYTSYLNYENCSEKAISSAFQNNKMFDTSMYRSSGK